MTVDKRIRPEIHRKFAELSGDEHGAAVMELLPPVGWGEVATGRDLDLQFLETNRRVESLEVRVAAKIDLVGAEMHAQAVKIIFWLVPTMLTCSGLVIAASRIG